MKIPIEYVAWIALVLAMFAVLLLTVDIVGASPFIGFTYSSPTNGSTMYPEIAGGMNVTIATNESFNASCQMMFNNNGTLITMTNNTVGNTSWSSTFNIPSRNASIMNLRYRCGNVSSLYEWSNATDLHYFYVKDAKYSLIDRAITNNSVFSYRPVLNLSVVSDNATNCTYTFNKTKYAMTYSVRGWWTNASATDWPDSAFGVSHNISYNCTDSVGNYSYIGLYMLKLDTAKPSFPYAPVYSSIGNLTAGNYMDIVINTTDANPGYCGLSLYYGSGRIRNVSSNVTYSQATTNTNCTVRLSPSDIVEDGFAQVVAHVKDDAGNENASVSNNSYIMYRLKTGWNIITGYENKTLGQIAAEFPNVTYVSPFLNLANMKNFTTYTVGGSTNAGLSVNFSSEYGYGAAYVYVTQDVVSMRRYYDVPSAWQSVNLYANSTAGLTSWNLVGVTKQLTNLNSTVMQDVCGNVSITATNESRVAANLSLSAVTYPYIITLTGVTNSTHTISLGNFTYNATHVNFTSLGAGAAGIDHALAYNYSYTWTPAYSRANCANVTWVSFYSVQDGKFCSFYRNRLATSCSLTSAQYNLTRGDAMWIAVQPVNITLARGSWS